MNWQSRDSILSGELIGMHTGECLRWPDRGRPDEMLALADAIAGTGTGEPIGHCLK
jgi:hypothetical protein